MKKILYIVHGYPPYQYAGTENYSYALANEISDKKFCVAVFYPIFTPNLKKMNLSVKKFENHTVYEVETNHYSILNNLFNEEIELLFDKVIQHFSPDIIHFQHIHAIFPFSLCLKSIASKIPTVITLHDFWYICPKTYMINGDGSLCKGPTSPEKCAKCFLKTESVDLKNNISLRHYTTHLFTKRLDIARLIFLNAKLTTAPSRFLLDKYKQFVKFKQCLKLPLGLDVSTHVQNKTFCKSIRFGFLGNITPLKNIHGMIKSFLRTTGDATLHIYGKVTDRGLSDALNDLASTDNRITLHGRYSPKDLGGILSQIDIGIVPSFFENYPLVVREFLNAKIPVIASRVGGIPEIIIHNNNGILFDPQNNDELHHYIQAIIDNPNLIYVLKSNINAVKTIEQDSHVWSEIYNSL